MLFDGLFVSCLFCLVVFCVVLFVLFVYLFDCLFACSILFLSVRSFVAVLVVFLCSLLLLLPPLLLLLLLLVVVVVVVVVVDDVDDHDVDDDDDDDDDATDHGDDVSSASLVYARLSCLFDISRRGRITHFSFAALLIQGWLCTCEHCATLSLGHGHSNSAAWFFLAFWWAPVNLHYMAWPR